MVRKDYSKKELIHPLKKKEIPHIEFSTRAKKIVFQLVVFFFVIGGIYTLFFSSVFSVRYITIQGAHRADVYSLAQEWLSKQNKKKIFQRISGNNIFFIPTEDLRTILLLDRFVSDITIKKQFPQTLRVVVSERIERVAYLFNNVVYILDDTGNMVTRYAYDNVLEKKYQHIPKVYGTSTEQFIVNEVSQFSEQLVQFIYNLSVEYPKFISDVTLIYFTVNTPQNTVSAYTAGGWYIVLDPFASVVVQLSNLSRVYYETITEEEKRGLEYIDVRLENYLYYK